MSKLPAKRIEHLEQVCMGAGFLLKLLIAEYGGDFSIGMEDQVRDCIRDCEEATRVYLHRKNASQGKDHE